MARKRAFVRYSKNGKIVPGSLILTSGSYPSGPSTWNEVPADLCCDNPIALTYEVELVEITLITMRLFCNGELIGTYFTSQDSDSAISLQNVLNNTFGMIGTFTVDDNKVITLTMTATQKNELCPSGTLSFTVFAD